MSQPPFEIEAPRAGTELAEESTHGRTPFVAPRVEALGGLTDVTLLGGSL